MNSARHGMEQVGMGGFQTRRPPRSFGGGDGGGYGGDGGGGFNDGSGEPPAKRGNFNKMFGGRGYGSGGGFAPPQRGGHGKFAIFLYLVFFLWVIEFLVQVSKINFCMKSIY